MHKPKFLIVKGTSMYPIIKNNDIVFYEEQSSYNIDDIVIVKLNTCFCHRIINHSSNKEFYLLKGDNVLNNDGWIRNTCIIGKVISIIHVI